MLDRYLQRQASRDVRKRVAACFVMVEAATSTLAGYYTLSATSVLLAELPEAMTRRLPRYPVVPAVLLGRLAVASKFQGKRLGAALLADAVTRASRADIAAWAIVTDPKDETARSFYLEFGFHELAVPERRLCVPIEFFAALSGAMRA